MKSIKIFLQNKKVSELKDICRKFKLSGYANKNKGVIIDLILETINNPQVNDIILSLIPSNGTSAQILKVFLDKNNEVGYRTLLQEVKKTYSDTTFRKYYAILSDEFILFDDEKTDDDTIFLPKEFTKLAKSFVNKHITDKSIEKEELTKVERDSSQITTLDQLLKSKRYTRVEKLSDILDSLKMSHTGNKTQMIERLLYESNESSENIINLIFQKIKLSMICEDLGLPVSGNKDLLINRILSKLRLANKSKKRIIAPKSPAMATEARPKPKAKPKPTPKVKPTPKAKPKPHVISLRNNIAKLLDSIPLPIDMIKNKEDLEKIFLTVVEMQIQSKDNLKGTIFSKGSKSTDEPTFIAKKDNKKVGISVWYFKKKDASKWREAITKVLYYQDVYGKELIYYILDHSGNALGSHDIEILKKQVDVVYKEGREFIKED